MKKLMYSHVNTDYGRPMKPFSLKSRTFGLEQIIWADRFIGIWGIFYRFISTHFGTVSPLSMFSINYFYKQLSLYIQIPNFCLGFEFGPQRIRDLCVHSLCIVPMRISPLSVIVTSLCINLTHAQHTVQYLI